ncbi:MAG TPA: UvrD-helicase domain-containing protein [Polyangia bacterium]|nr:UvrD-helicase domain-containing protein [Polyangia bacterium]
MPSRPPSRISLDDLNPPQRQAVTITEGPLLVLAGAGSGKTRVITYRVAHLLERGARADEILAVSFTNKAAEEMRERVSALVGPHETRRLTLSTFHALGLQILKRERTAMGLGSGFTVYDTADQLGVVREILRQVKIDDRRFDPKAILFRISRWKNAFYGPDELPPPEGDYDEIGGLVYPRYQAAMRGFHALDFDDLIVAVVRLLDENEEVRERWQGRFRYLMIDEYQDTNRAQLLLVRHLAAVCKNLCVVGDDDQSIYAWRGAESGNILEFSRHFPGAQMIKLEENYRSTPHILEAANAVIANNGRRHPKRLFTTRPAGEKLQLVVAPDPETEARFVAEEIELLRARRGYRLGDCAVLYRSNIQARAFEEALRAQRISYRMIGGQAFYERKEVKDAIAYLKAAIHPRDEIALRRVINYPARGIGETTVERCAAYAQAHRTTLWNALVQADRIEGLSAAPRDMICGFVALLQEHRPALERGRDLAPAARALLEEVGMFEDLRAAATSPSAAQRRIEHLEGFLTALGAWEERTLAQRPAPAAEGEGGEGAGAPVLDYLHRLTLSSSDDDNADGEDPDQVTLVTLHGAKGLEFPVVFLVGLEEELLPHRRTLYPHETDMGGETATDLSEERRLLYVGITRARELLYLTRCRARGYRSATKPRTPSRFLDEVPEELCVARDLDLPIKLDPADEEAFARDCLAKLRNLVK